MGCCMEPAVVHIAHVLQKLHFFQFFNFFPNLYDLPPKNFTRFLQKTILFFYNLHDLPQKKITRTYRKKITGLEDFFCTRVTFSTLFCVSSTAFPFSHPTAV